MKTFLAWLATTGAIALFLFSCFVAASDGQGALLFIFTFPVLYLLLAVAIIFTRGSRGGAYWASRVSLVFTLSFLIFSFIPGLNLFTKTVMNGVSYTFKSVTGQTPYAWVRARNHISVKIEKALQESGGQELDLKKISASFQWERVCFFGPYTSDEAASKVLQLTYEWKLSSNSKVDHSDGINAFVFLYEGKNRSVPAVADLSRSQADFAKLSGQCFPKEKARFVMMPGESKEFKLAAE